VCEGGGRAGRQRRVVACARGGPFYFSRADHDFWLRGGGLGRVRPGSPLGLLLLCCSAPAASPSASRPNLTLLSSLSSPVWPASTSSSVVRLSCPSAQCHRSGSAQHECLTQPSTSRLPTRALTCCFRWCHLVRDLAKLRWSAEAGDGPLELISSSSLLTNSAVSARASSVRPCSSRRVAPRRCQPPELTPSDRWLQPRRRACCSRRPA
jgi:hypothetical protein